MWLFGGIAHFFTTLCLIYISTGILTPSHAIPHRRPSLKGNAIIPHLLDRVDDAGRWSSIIPSDKPERKNPKNQPKITKEEIRLPINLRPTLQTIHLIPMIDLINSGTYTTIGYTEIFFTCVEPTNNITLNSVDLTINRASIAVLHHYL